MTYINGKPILFGAEINKIVVSDEAYEEGYNKAYSEVESLNTELETTLYGGDTASERTLEENVRQANSDFVAIKEKIVECGVEVAVGTHTREYAPKVGKVYEAGKKSQYDEFWDNYQDYGKRTVYWVGFRLWNDIILHPKYDIKPVGNSDSIFRDITGITDFEQWQKNCGIVVDFSEATSINDGFYGSSFESIGVLNFSKVGTMNFCFSSSKIKDIKKIILSTDKVTTFNHSFNNARELEEIRFEGIIKNNIDFQWSTKLSKASITSVINALSTTTNGLTVALSKTAVESAFGSTTSAEWTTLIGTRSNWTISLI